MFLKNAANQTIFFGLVNAGSGAALTGATPSGVYSIDNATSNPSGYKQNQTCGGTFTEMGSGQYRYVPLQAETNGADLAFTFAATGAVPVTVYIVTDAAVSAIPTNPLTSLGTNAPAGWINAAAVAGNPSVNTAQWGGSNVTGMPMPTYTQPSGFLAASFPTTVASPTNITGGTITTVSGNVNGSVGSIAGVTFPSGFNTLTTTAIAAAVLKTPANLLSTDSSGNVTANNSDFLTSQESAWLSDASEWAGNVYNHMIANGNDFLSSAEQNQLSSAANQAASAASSAASAVTYAQALPSAAQLVAATIAALEAAGILQQVPGASSSSGQTEPALQFTAQALAASPAASSVSITTQDVVIRSNS